MKSKQIHFMMNPVSTVTDQLDIFDSLIIYFLSDRQSTNHYQLRIMLPIASKVEVAEILPAVMFLYFFYSQMVCSLI